MSTPSTPVVPTDSALPATTAQGAVPTTTAQSASANGYAQGSQNNGLPVTQGGNYSSALYTPAAFVDAQAPTMPPSITQYVQSNSIANVNWIRQAFMLNTLPTPLTGSPQYIDISTMDMARRIFSTAAWNYNDTTLGGNWAINASPQFTEFADIAVGGDATRQNATTRTSMTTTGGWGEGRIYHEVLEKNSSYVTMSFGVPAFNSLASFFGNFYDPQASSLVRTGRAKGALFQLGNAAGWLLALPFKPIVFGSTVVKSAMNIPSTQFSYFKPTMPIYWNMVNIILNSITANIGIHQRVLNPYESPMYNDPNMPTGSNTNYQASDIESDMAKMNKLMPDIYHAFSSNDGSTMSSAGIDVYAVANKSQRLANAFEARLINAMQGTNAAPMTGAGMQVQISNALAGNLTYATSGSTMSLSDALKNYLTSSLGGILATAGENSTVESMGGSSTTVPSNTATSNSGGTSGAAGTPTNNATPTPTPNTGASPSATPATAPGAVNPTAANGVPSSWWSGLWNEFITATKADLRDGSNWITFKVNYGGEIGESFSNTTKQSDVQQKINSMSSDARTAEYNVADGDIGGGFVGAIAGGIVSGVSDVLSGIGAGLHLSGLAALGGAAYIDIPELYDSSSTTLPSESYTVELRSWSGNRIALLQNIYFPLACLLAGVMPRATGPASWNAPFQCQLFSKGRMQIRNGIITDMQITRGTGNVGFSPEHRLPLSVNVTFTVKDLSSMLYAPVIANSGFLAAATLQVGESLGSLLGNAQAGEAAGAALTSASYSDQSVFSDYMAILSALGWKDQIYPGRKFAIARDRTTLDFEMFKSPYHAAGWFAGSWPGQILSAVVHGTDRP
jgi:hypothetical protein